MLEDFAYLIVGVLVIALSAMTLRILDWNKSKGLIDHAPGDVKSDAALLGMLSNAGIVVGSLVVLKGGYDLYQEFFGGPSNAIPTSASLQGGDVPFARYL